MWIRGVGDSVDLVAGEDVCVTSVGFGVDLVVGEAVWVTGVGAMVVSSAGRWLFIQSR